MASGLIFFGMFFLIFFILIIVLSRAKPTTVHLAFHSFSNRKRSTALAITGLLIGSSIISGSLILGDSMNHMVRSITLENLGELDITVTSNSYFDYDIYNELASDPELLELTDKLAPAISLYGSAEGSGRGTLISKLRVIGYNDIAHQFGDLKTKSALKPADTNGANITSEFILNDLAADALEVNPGDVVKLVLVSPEYSLDSIYLQDFNISNRIELTLIVSEIVYREGFGKLQSSGRTSFRETAYLPLEFLQEQLGIGDKINTIFISNVGDAESGIEKDDEVEERLEILLDELTGAEDLKLELRNAGDHNYIRYSSSNIFFPDYHREFMDDIEALEDVDGYSTALTYFVNYMQSERGSTVWYSTVTGIESDIDNRYQDFTDHNSGEKIAGDISDSEIIIDNWTAEALNIGIGDVIELNYMILDRVFTPQYISVNFTVKFIVDKTGMAADRYLMPDFPGIDMDEDLEPIDWADLFYVNRTRVLELKGGFEQRYWTDFRGAPKAFITLDAAKRLWSNDYGDLTSLKIYYDESSVSGLSGYQALEAAVSEKLEEKIGYRDAGISINHVKKDAFESASALDIFPQMFLAFGAIIILAGAIFVMNIMVTMVYNRRRELGILRAMGSRRKTVASILTLEGVLYAVPASVLGTLLGILIAYGLSWGLNNIWSDIVEGYSIPFYFSIESLFYGFLGGLIIGLIAVGAASYRISRLSIVRNLRADNSVDNDTGMQPGSGHGKPQGVKGIFGSLLIGSGVVLAMTSISTSGNFDESNLIILGLIAPVLFIFGILLLSHAYLRYKNKPSGKKIQSRLNSLFGLALLLITLFYTFDSFRDPDVPGLAMFFTAGLVLLLAFLLFVSGSIFGFEGSSAGDMVSSKKDMIRMLVARNIVRNRFRTLSTIAMFSLIVFLIFALATNIMLQSSGQEKASELAGGGYQLYAESTIPINFDVNDEQTRIKYGVDNELFNDLELIPLKSVGHEVGKCSNMNAVYPPRIYGVDDRFTETNEFEFMRTAEEDASADEVWSELQNFEEVNGTVPIIGDYETLIWIYGGDIGSVFELTDDYGNVYELEVIGIINSPIFAGSFIMAEHNFDLIFPISGELKSFLGKTTGNTDEVQAALEWEYRDFGLSVTTVDEIAQEATEFVAAYMSLFQLYLYFGLIVGISALGILSLKATSERKYEIGVMKAIGFRNRQVFFSFILENAAISSIGILIGAVTGILMAILAYPFWGLSRLEFTTEMAIFLMGVVFSVLFITILLTLYPALRVSKLSSAEALRNLE